MNAVRDAVQLGLDLAEALSAEGVSYALGGALAYGLFGVPRGTNDVAVNVFVTPAGLAPVFRALAAIGAEVDPNRAERDARAEGAFAAHADGMRIDVFVPSIPFAWEAEGLRVSQNVDGRRAYFLSAEALAVFKLLFFRSKDLVDLEHLVAVQGDRLDRGFVRARLVDMMGADDERVVAWDRIVSRFAARA